MQKLKIFFLSLILIFAISTGVRAEFFSDVIVTSPNGIWTDSRSYTNLNDAVTAVGTVNQRTIVIASPQTVTALTVPSNITLRFERDGAIVNSGQLTINTKNIISDGHKIFAGLGDIDFAAGTVVKLSWFHDLWNALTMTSDDHVTMVIDKAINATASVAVGNDVTLRWEAPNIITANAGVTVSNIGQIEAGSYQILAGAGNFRFRDGVSLNLEWFPYLRMALTWIDTTDATIVVNESSDVDYSDSVPLNIQLKINNGGALDIAPGVTLTIANSKQIDIGPCLFDPFTGTGSVTITGGTTYTPATILTATALCTLSTHGYEVDALMSYGNGTDYTDTTLMAACTAVGADAATILVRPGTWIQSSNRDYVAVCPNAVFKLPVGALISHGTNTLTIKHDAGTYQIFSGTGTVTIPNLDKYPVQWRGAVGDNSTDNYDAITAANRDVVASAALTPALGYYRPKLWFPPSLGYRVETGVVIGAGIDVIMDSPLLYVGDANAAGTALTIGAAADYNWNANLHLNVMRVTQSDWTESDSTGIKIFNCYQSNILIQNASKFTNGVQFIGDTKGFVYNEVTLQYIADNAYGVTLIDGSASGWVNENNFYGGRFSNTTGTNTSVSRSAIKITSNNAYYHNNNNFYKPSFEIGNSSLTGTATSVPILLEYSNRNAFYNCRFEGSGTTYATVSNLSSYNTINTGYGSGTISNISHTGSYADTVITAKSTTHTNSPTEIFNSGAMHKTVGYYDATKCHIPRVHIAYSSAQTPYAANTNITPSDYHVEVGFGRGVGVFVDTSVYKRFVIKKDVVSGYGGRIFINAYDSTGTLLTSAGANHPYILGMSGNDFPYGSNFGGSYGTGGDNDNNIVFTCHADVQYVRVALTAGTKVLKIRSFSIQSLDGGSPAVWAGYEEIIPGAHLASQSPTLGTMWRAGSHVYDDTPAASTTPGWVCVFQLETTSAEEISASEKTDISITSLTGVVAGDIVGIELDDGTIYWDSVADVTGGDLTLTGSGPASVAASGNAVYFFRFKAMASLGA